MKLAVYTLAVVSALALSVRAQDQPALSREYAIKAAFLHKFMLFTEWSREKLPDGNEPLILAIIGEDPFGNAFEPLKNELVRGRKVVIKRYEGIGEPNSSDKAYMDGIKQALVQSHVLFICSSEQDSVRDILEMVRAGSVLTIADVPGFAESGGMIGLSVEGVKVRFEINNTAANEAGLKIGSQLLRMAKRVISDGSSGSAAR